MEQKLVVKLKKKKATYAMLRELGEAKKEAFDTEAERDAYIRGLEDASGWMEVYWEKL